MSRTANCILLGIACIASAVAWTQTSGSNANASANSLTVLFKDGHQKTYADVNRIDFKGPGAMVLTHGGREERLSLADVSRIDFSPSAAFRIGRNHFVGKWKVGDGAGNDFFITLDRNGEARKTLGATRGTWEVVDGEARISWDDGWHDVIRSVGTKHEKVAYEPGKSFDADPNNITDASRVDAQPI
jgi:hypothetical protein